MRRTVVVVDLPQPLRQRSTATDRDAQIVHDLHPQRVLRLRMQHDDLVDPQTEPVAFLFELARDHAADLVRLRSVTTSTCSFLPNTARNNASSAARSHASIVRFASFTSFTSTCFGFTTTSTRATACCRPRSAASAT